MMGFNDDTLASDFFAINPNSPFVSQQQALATHSRILVFH